MKGTYLKLDDVNNMLKALNLDYNSLSDETKVAIQESIILEQKIELEKEIYALRMIGIKAQMQIFQIKLMRNRNAMKKKKIKLLFESLKKILNLDSFTIQKIVNILINQLELFKIALHFTDTTQINKNILTQTTYYKTLTKRP